MRHVFLLFAVFSLLVAPACAKEAFVNLEDYVTKAEAIAICVVQKGNGNGTVTASITQVLKGDLSKSEIIRGETGHCVMQGPVSRFMKPNNKYLVFLFKNNIVGRLGGILQVEDKTLVFSFLSGFEGVRHDKDNFLIQRLPLDEGIEQINTLLKPKK